MTELKNNSFGLKNTNKDQLTSKLKENKKYFLILLGVIILLAIFFFESSKKNDVIEVPVASPENTLKISEEQAKQIKWGSVKTYDFQERKEAVGIIDFDRNKTAEIYSPYQGRINRVL